MNKISRIELNDFRGFEGSRVLDFDNSDIVILYGMNGLGKTSVFDAIEWGFTGKLARYEPYLEVGKKQDFSSEKQVLRNKQASNPQTQIKIYLNDGSQFGRKVLVGKNNCDYNDGQPIANFQMGLGSLSKQGVDYEYAHDYFSATHMLSQETINHFITAKLPEDRYRALAVNFGTSLYSPFDDNISKLSSNLKKNISDIKIQLDEKKLSLGDLNFQIKIADDVVKSEIEKFNRRAESLNSSSDFKIRSIELTTLDATIDEIEIRIINCITATEARLAELNSKREASLLVSSDFKKWEKSVTNATVLQDKIIELKNSLSTLESLRNEEATIQQLLVVSKEQEIHKNRLMSSAFRIKDMLPFYFEQQETFENLQNELHRLSEENELNHNLSREHSGQRQGSEVKLSELEYNVKSLEEAEVKILSLIERQKAANDQLAKLKERSDPLNVKIAQFKKSLDVILKAEHALDSEDKIESQITLKISDLKSATVDYSKLIYLKEQTGLVPKLGERRDEIKIKIKMLIDKIEHFKEQMGQKHALLQSALELIPDQKAVLCPVCEVEHPHDALTSGIRDRLDSHIHADLVDLYKELEDLKAEHDKVDQNIQYIMHEFIIEKNYQRSILQRIRHDINTELDHTTSLFDQCAKEMAELKYSIDNAYEVLRAIYPKLSSSLEDALANCRTEISENKSLRDAAHHDLEKFRQEASILSDRIFYSLQQQDILRSKLADITKSQRYEDTRNFLSGIGVKHKSEANLKTHNYIQTYTDEYNSIKLTIEQSESLIASIREKIKYFTSKGSEEDQRLRLSELETEASQVDNFIIRYKENCIVAGLTIESLTSDSIKKHTDNGAKEANKLFERKSLIGELSVSVNIFKDYLKERNFKDRATAIQKQIDALEQKHTKIQNLFASVDGMGKRFTGTISSYVKDNLGNDFFNTIYKSLNPHQRYKMIEMKAQVHRNSLGLSLHTNDSGVDARPEFLFSSGQLNTLGVSMFLSMALRQNWLDLDTILMDDPIQNLDDINILSFIDLIRGLLDGSQKKQLVFSTHDVRFYNLVKRKFANYKVKAFKFESYGSFSPDILS